IKVWLELAGGVELVRQVEVTEVAGQRSGQAVELPDGSVSRGVRQFVAEGDGGADVAAGWAEELTEDGCHRDHGPSAGRYGPPPQRPLRRRPGRQGWWIGSRRIRDTRRAAPRARPWCQQSPRHRRPALPAGHQSRPRHRTEVTVRR